MKYISIRILLALLASRKKAKIDQMDVNTVQHSFTTCGMKSCTSTGQNDSLCLAKRIISASYEKHCMD